VAYGRRILGRSRSAPGRGGRRHGHAERDGREEVKDIDPAKAAFGHDGLAGAVGDFCDRWEIGVEHLCTDANEIVDRLNWSMQAYTHVENTLAHVFNGILSEPSGPDPAAQ
jgi:hypothetical protein